VAEQQLSIGELAAAVVANDDELRIQLKGLVTDIIGNMRYTMRHGDPAAKIALSKSVIPQLLSAINKVDTEKARESEKAAYDRLLAAVRGESDASSP
jgi:hypothetical protein